MVRAPYDLRRPVAGVLPLQPDPARAVTTQLLQGEPDVLVKTVLMREVARKRALRGFVVSYRPNQLRSPPACKLRLSSVSL